MSPTFERQGGLYTLREVIRGFRALHEPGRIMPMEEIVDELPGAGADGEGDVAVRAVPQHEHPDPEVMRAHSLTHLPHRPW